MARRLWEAEVCAALCASPLRGGGGAEPFGGTQRARAVMAEFLCRGFIGRLEDVSGLHGRSFPSKYAMMPYRMERCRFL